MFLLGELSPSVFTDTLDFMILLFINDTLSRSSWCFGSLTWIKCIRRLFKTSLFDLEWLGVLTDPLASSSCILRKLIMVSRTFLPLGDTFPLLLLFMLGE